MNKRTPYFIPVFVTLTIVYFSIKAVSAKVYQTESGTVKEDVKIIAEDLKNKVGDKVHGVSVMIDNIVLDLKSGALVIRSKDGDSSQIFEMRLKSDSVTFFMKGRHYHEPDK